MTKVLNFGSLNVDHVYRVEHFVRPGETLGCHDYRRFAGGKGLNQSIALAHAGASVYHAGKVSRADDWLKILLDEHKVDTRFVEATDGPGGHAIIQVNEAGENSIVIVGGANRTIGKADVLRIIGGFRAGDYLLVQNETSMVPQMICAAKKRGLKVVFNPAPMDEAVAGYPLELVDIFLLNETEAQSLSGESNADRAGAVMCRRYPNAETVLTMGGKGASYFSSKSRFHQPAKRVRAVDTTAAGDTFTGFFLAELIRVGDPAVALAFACRAAAVCVTRHGAADSIPWRKEIDHSRP
jgi:ribokinase